MSANDPAPSAEVAEQLASLARRYGLGASALAQLADLLGMLATDPNAPTSIREPTRIAMDHLADSLVGLELPAVGEASAIGDIGSGAGLPGLPLAFALPAAHVWLVESSAPKCRFLSDAATRCGATNATVVHTRVEEWQAGHCSCDLVTVRAVAPLEVVAEYAAPLLRIGGSLVAWRGRRDAEAESAANRAAAVLGLEAYTPIAVQPYEAAVHRHLHVMRKVRETPPRFPRRPGMARKRPLGGAA